MKKILTPYATNLTKCRIGRDEDGGYVLAKELLEQSDAVYSYGIGNEYSFDVHCMVIGKPVIMFDDKKNTLGFPFNHKQMPFNAAFSEQIEHNNITVKIDVEGAEWDGLTYCDPKVFDRINQIVVECHNMQENNDQQKEMLLNLLKRYVIIHVHANNFGARNSWLPQTIEISFARKDFVERIDKESCPYPVTGLDFPNNSTRPDHPLNWWL